MFEYYAIVLSVVFRIYNTKRKTLLYVRTTLWTRKNKYIYMYMCVRVCILNTYYRFYMKKKNNNNNNKVARMFVKSYYYNNNNNTMVD